jgi:HEAT repeat protein
VSLCGCAASAVSSRVSSDIARGDFRSALSRYEQNRSSSVLRTLSESILLYAARSSDPAERRSAFIELSMLGTRASDLLEDLSQSGEAPAIRAEALRLRTQLGDDSARRELRALLDHPDPEVVDSAVQALAPEHDAALLAAALRSPRPERRATALALFSRAAPEHRAVLLEASRFDPTPQLRVAAVHALERYGAEAADALDAATHDPDEHVRVAALSALARVAPDRAEPVLDRQLGAAVSEHSISAAITLLNMQPPRQAARAQAAIAAALASPDVTLRARAASALQRLPSSELDRTGVRTRLRVEKAETVRLALALLLGPEDSAAQRTLTELSALFTLPGAEAAAELAAHSGSARARLCAFSAHDSALVRMTAARLIASTLRDPDPIAKLLADTSWQVRGAAAGAVLNVL